MGTSTDVLSKDVKVGRDEKNSNVLFGAQGKMKATSWLAFGARPPERSAKVSPITALRMNIRPEQRIHPVYNAPGVPGISSPVLEPRTRRTSISFKHECMITCIPANFRLGSWTGWCIGQRRCQFAQE